MEENQVKIPEGWIEKEIGKIIFERKKSGLKVSDASNHGRFPFFTSGEQILWHTEKIVDGENIFLATGGVANVKYYDGETAYSTDTYAIYTDEQTHTKYLYFELLNINYYINANYFQGSGLKHLQKKDFKNHILKIPKSTTEQHQIATILSKVDKAITQTQQLIAKYQRIKTGLMQDLLTKGIDESGNIRSEETHEFKDSTLGRIPVEWEADSLGNIIGRGNGIIQTGPFGSQLHANEYVLEGIPVIMPQDIKTENIDDSQIARISDEKTLKLKRHIVKENDILFARRGDLNKCNSITKEFEGAICGTGCLLIRPNNSKLNSNWLVVIYKHHSIQKEIDITAVGSTMKNLNTTILSNLFIPRIPIDEQDLIMDKLTNCVNTVVANQNQLKKLNSIKTGLMQDLLSGKVRVNHLIKETESV